MNGLLQDFRYAAAIRKSPGLRDGRHPYARTRHRREYGYLSVANASSCEIYLLGPAAARCCEHRKSADDRSQLSFTTLTIPRPESRLRKYSCVWDGVQRLPARRGCTHSECSERCTFP